MIPNPHAAFEIVRSSHCRKAVLLVDPSVDARSRLVERLHDEGLQVCIAKTLAGALQLAEKQVFDFAMTELRLKDGDAIDVIKMLQSRNPTCRVIVHSRYCNLSTTVAATKQGASDVLPKPADPDFLAAIILGHRLGTEEFGEYVGNPMELRVEYIQQIYESRSRSCSKTASDLSMHRRTLHRILKRARQKTAACNSALSPAKLP